MSWSIYVGTTNNPGGGVTPQELKAKAAEQFGNLVSRMNTPEYDVEAKTVATAAAMVDSNLDWLIANNSKNFYALEAFGSMTLPPKDSSWNYSCDTTFSVRLSQVPPAPEKAASAS